MPPIKHKGYISVGEPWRNKNGTLVKPHHFTFKGKSGEKRAWKKAQAQNAAIHIQKNRARMANRPHKK